jgi:hypothetical protein
MLARDAHARTPRLVERVQKEDTVMAKKTKVRQARDEINLRRPRDAVAVAAVVEDGEWKVVLAPPGECESHGGDGQAEATRGAGRHRLAPGEQPAVEAVAWPEDETVIAANREKIVVLRQRTYGAVYDLADVSAGEAPLVAAIAVGLGALSSGAALVHASVIPAFVAILIVIVGAVVFELAIVLLHRRSRRSRPAQLLRKRGADKLTSGDETACASHHQCRSRDMTVEEVGSAGPKLGFDGKPLRRLHFEGSGPGI